MHRTPAHRLLALVAVGALALAACSSDGSDGSSPKADDAAATTTATDGDATTTAPTTEPADDPTAASAVGPGEVNEAEPVPSSGCGTAATEPVERAKVPVGDTDRYYLLSTPEEVADPDLPLPLVLDFHGLLEGAEVHAMNSMLDTYAADHGFVVAFPNGLGDPIHWEVQPDREGNADLVYVDAVLDQLEAQQCIDTSRVYSTGLSNGAFMSSTIGCTMADRFAAIAPVAGLTFPDGCDPGRLVPVLTFHGTADPILGFNGGVDLSSVEGGTPTEKPPADTSYEAEGYPANARDWAEVDRCDPEPTDTELTPSVTHRVWTCPAGAAVEFDLITGGGHTWPGTQFSVPLEDIMGGTDQSIDANEVIWAFFQRFTLPAS